jgi:CRISPR/Cas system-associated endonuclease Cas1
MSRARHAATPLNAMLNYVYIVGLGQCVRACAGLGLDPCHGFLHAPKRGRSSLAYDVLELLRADLTSAVFAHAVRTSFAPDAFELNKIGIVSLSPAVARDMAALALRTAISECSTQRQSVYLQDRGDCLGCAASAKGGRSQPVSQADLYELPNAVSEWPAAA